MFTRQRYQSNTTLRPTGITPASWKPPTCSPDNDDTFYSRVHLTEVPTYPVLGWFGRFNDDYQAYRARVLQ